MLEYSFCIHLCRHGIKSKVPYQYRKLFARNTKKDERMDAGAAAKARFSRTFLFSSLCYFEIKCGPRRSSSG